MKKLSEFLMPSYNNQREQWEKTLKYELKIEDVGSKGSKNVLGVGKWPTLSLESSIESPLTSGTEWKKAAQTYLEFPQNVAEALNDDLLSGVRLFFFNAEKLNSQVVTQINKIFSNFPEKQDIEVIILNGQQAFDLGVKTIQSTDYIHASEVEYWGGESVQELALLTLRLIRNQKNMPLAVYVDSHFFKNISKIRAAKLLALKVYEELGINKEVKIIALNSYREWTLFERYSNMLRNDAQVASALIAGADYVQSSGYEVLFDIETDYKNSEHDERSRRMARNTSHILSLESMLGVVQDASFGSFHLESLSQELASKAWTLMQELVGLDESEQLKKLQALSVSVSESRLLSVETRKTIMAGMNDFPDAKEHLNFNFTSGKAFRVSRKFEELRMKVSKMSNLPKVYVKLEGDYGALNPRINFIKNYFELIGLEVIDPLEGKKPSTKDVVVYCAKDEDYEKFISSDKDTAFEKYLAGKVEVQGAQMIHAGQNVYKVLASLVSKMGGN